jgi:hypothetical protein
MAKKIDAERHGVTCTLRPYIVIQSATTVRRRGPTRARGYRLGPRLHIEDRGRLKLVKGIKDKDVQGHGGI